MKKNKFGNPAWPFKIDEVNSYAYWESAFSAEECNTIIKIAKEKGLIRGTTFGEDVTNKKQSNKIRKSEITWLYPSDDLEFVYRRITDIVTTLNEQYFKFDLFGLTEGLQFTNYKSPGGKYGSHVDRRLDFVVRKMSISIQLSDPNDYDGGELFLYEDDNGSLMKKEQGTLIMFPSYILHEVTPVTKGERNSLVSWVTGPAFK